VRHPADADEVLEVPGHELRAVVGDDAGLLGAAWLAVARE